MSSKFAIYQNISKIYSNKLNPVSFTRVFLVEQVKHERKREREREVLNSNDKSRKVLYTISNEAE